jgi:uncharacterized membrane protein
MIWDGFGGSWIILPIIGIFMIFCFLLMFGMMFMRSSRGGGFGPFGGGQQGTRNTDRRAEPEEGNAALRILKERYARGEITEAEYKRMRDDLAF